MNHRAYLYTEPTATPALNHVPLFLIHSPNLPVWAGGFIWPRLISVPYTSSLPSAVSGFPSFLRQSNLLLPSLAGQTNIVFCCKNRSFQGNTHYLNWQVHETVKASKQRDLPISQALYEATLPPSPTLLQASEFPEGQSQARPGLQPLHTGGKQHTSSKQGIIRS